MEKVLQYLVIHCTATPAGLEVSAADIRRWHTAPVSAGGMGWKQVGYTDIFHLDGTCDRLVENNEDGVVDAREITNGAKGYNRVSRHIAYVGGCDSSGKPADTRTPAQKEAMRRYVLDFHRRHPAVRIIGHRDLPRVRKACPAFNVAQWLNEIGINPHAE